MTRGRVSPGTLRLLWKRERLTQAWIDEVNEFLLGAGWVLIDAGKTYGLVRTEVVQNWPRLTYKLVEQEFENMGRVELDASYGRLLDQSHWISGKLRTTSAREGEDEE